jgi:mannosyltransferase OCH1-like enzyme
MGRQEDLLGLHMLKRIRNSFQFRYPQLAARLFNEIPLESVLELNSGASTSWRHRIPNHVYMTWEENNFGKTHANGLRQFRDLNHDCHFHFYDAKACDEYMDQNYGNHPILSVYKSSRAGAMKADIWRYCILYERGGFYFDINKCITVPLNQLVNLEDQALLSYENNFFEDVLPKEKAARLPLVLPHNSNYQLQYTSRPLLNWGLAFTAGHLLLERTIENIVKYAPYFEGKKFARMREPIIELTGPIMFTRTFYECLNANLEFSVTQCGIDFNGQGDPNMKGGWVRYLKNKSYVSIKDVSIF